MTMTMETNPESVSQPTAEDNAKDQEEQKNMEAMDEVDVGDDQASSAASAESGSEPPSPTEPDDHGHENENDNIENEQSAGADEAVQTLTQSDTDDVIDNESDDDRVDDEPEGEEEKKQNESDENDENFAADGVSSDVADNLNKEDHSDEMEREHGDEEDEESVSHSVSESESEDEEDEEAHEEEEMPEGDSNADLHALLAFSKSRLEKVPQAPAVVEPPVQEAVEEDADPTDDEADEEEVSIKEEVLADNENNQETMNEDEQLEIAKKKLMAAQQLAAEDDDDMAVVPNSSLPIPTPPPPQPHSPSPSSLNLQEPTQTARSSTPADLLKLAEQKVREAELKAKQDEAATSAAMGGGAVEVVKPAVTTTKRSEANAELWALLNYSKMRLETGSTPQMAKSGKEKSKDKDDNMSVSSKTSKRSLNSKKSITSKASGMGSVSGRGAPVSVVGASGQDLGADFNEEAGDMPFPDVTSGNEDDAGSVGSDMKNSIEEEDNEDDESRNSDSDEESSSSEEEEEDELPDFLKDDDNEQIDPQEAKRLYEAARSYGASILSVSEEKLTDVQMLQAIAIAEEAAKKGESKFSTKGSLFKLHEAKLEDLKAFLDFSGDKNSENGPTSTGTEKRQSQSAQVGWGIGKGRFVKKMGAVFQDFKQRCEEIDERKQQERRTQPSNKEILSAAFLDLKKELDNYEAVQVMKRKASMESK